MNLVNYFSENTIDNKYKIKLASNISWEIQKKIKKAAYKIF